MKLQNMVLALALTSLAACSDKSDENATEKTSLTDRASQMNSQLVDSMKEKSREVAESLATSVDSAQQTISKSVDAARETGSEMVDSAVEKSRSLADSASQSLASTQPPMETDVAKQNAADTIVQAQTTVTEAKVVVGETQAEMAANVGEVETAAMEASSVVSADAGSDDVVLGKRVYSGNCMACHAAGVAGAPKIGDPDLWQTRIAQGMDTLNQHAINGFKGTVGYMPPKGGFMSLNDDEVKAAVAYMVSESQ